ncbi:SDR family NAD(P)-dependent oxidoreductase [Symbioplanes lichenis]|uniref:SDR family NAD(P)-dependent oxidoreductase n=1 Tax=Symbioplanes lichenis TaxID=1629072 RepID=UPI00273880C0|nr:SDR family NAD(P)-dependent oxidoreductase [Actinoplanes lichenis]
MSPATPDLRGRVAVVTGATGGMGREIAARLAEAGARLVTVARDPVRAAGILGPEVDVVSGDLSRRDDVLRAAEIIAGRYEQVHILVNNAGGHFARHRLSADGVEMHVALDYLAAFGLMTRLEGPLRRGRARVVNVASDTLNDTRQITVAGRPRPATLDLAGVDSLARLNPAAGFVPFEAYARAKLMTVTAGYALARDLAPDGVTVNAVHPGIVSTDLIDDLVPPPLRPFRGLIRRTLLTPAQGAEPAVRLATAPGGTGKYFNRDAETATPPVSHDPATQQRLLALSESHFTR